VIMLQKAGNPQMLVDLDFYYQHLFIFKKNI